MVRGSHRHGFVERVRYRTDRLLARGPGVLLAVLAALVGLIVLAGGGLYWLVGADDIVASGPLWAAFSRVLDGGTQAGDAGFAVRVVSAVVTVSGLFAFGLLLAIFQADSQRRLDGLRRGAGPVFARRFDLVLGWNARATSVIEELVRGRGRRRVTVVVMSRRQATDIEDEVASHLPVAIRRRLHLVCRTGDPMDVADLDRLHFHRARSIVVLRDDAGPEACDLADLRVVKNLMALMRGSHGRPLPAALPLVAEVEGPASQELARLATGGRLGTGVAAGRVVAGRASVVSVREATGRLLAHATRQPGLCLAYEALLEGRSGSLCLLPAAPALAGVRFDDAFEWFRDAVPVGVACPEGRVVLNPGPDRILAAGDRLVTLAADRRVRPAARRHAVPAVEARSARGRAREVGRVLVLGWNRTLPLVLDELDRLYAAGSEARVVAPDPDGTRAAALAGTGSRWRHLAVAFEAGDPAQRTVLDAVDPASFDAVLRLAEDRGPVEETDARTLMSLLLLRAVRRRSGGEGDGRLRVVAELLEECNRGLVEADEGPDVVAVHRVASLLLARLALERDLWKVLGELLYAGHGHDNLFLKPAGLYVEVPDTGVARRRFREVQRAAQARGEIAIGWVRAAEALDAARGHGIRLNPGRDAELPLAAADRVVVLSTTEG